jgi:hypothetical protein
MATATVDIGTFIIRTPDVRGYESDLTVKR